MAGEIYIADKATLDNVDTNIGATTDIGGSSTAGTAMAKLNALIDGGQKSLTLKTTTYSLSAGTNDDITILNISGSGVFYSMYSTVALLTANTTSYGHKIYIDGSLFATYPAGGYSTSQTMLNAGIIASAGYYYYYSVLVNIGSSSMSLVPIPFKNNFQIKLCTPSDQTASTLTFLYSLYE